MNRMKNILAVIPARSGSKRLPGKNTKTLAGKSLIQWTIDAALECSALGEVLVSTDDLSVAELSKELGASVPFIRPKSLAEDSSTSIDVVLHALDYYESQQKKFEYVMLLQPTSPLRNTNHIGESVELLRTKNADAIISVCQAEHSPLWSNTLREDCSMASFMREELKNKRSQDLPDYYRLNGAIYLCNVSRLRREKAFLISDNIFAYKMDRKDSVDIDEILDFKLAELLINERFG